MGKKAQAKPQEFRKVKPLLSPQEQDAMRWVREVGRRHAPLIRPDRTNRYFVPQ